MLIGKMRLKLFVEVIGADDVLIFASVHKFSDGREVAFEGSYGFPLDNVTKGWLKASKRALGPAAEIIWDMLLMESATFFQAGDLMRLDIQGRWPSPFNPLTGNSPAAYQKSDPRTCLVHMGGEYPAQLIVPMMPARGIHAGPTAPATDSLTVGLGAEQHESPPTPHFSGARQAVCFTPR